MQIKEIPLKRFHPNGDGTDKESSGWAILRLVLGLLQTATASSVLLVARIGLAPPTIAICLSQRL